MDSSKNARRRDPTTPEPARRRAPPSTPNRKPTRRHVAKPKGGPSSLFLDSLKSADTPIPTVEVQDLDTDIVMVDSATTPIHPSGLMTPVHNNSFVTPVHNTSFLTPEQAADLRFTTPPPKSDALDSSFWSGEITPHRSDWDSHVRSGSPPFDIGSIGSDSSSERDLYCDENTSGEDCTSPDVRPSEAVFPLYGSLERKKYQHLLDQHPGLNMPNKKPRKPVDDEVWTFDMSKHLWTCFEKYCSEPTHTPFWHGAPPEGVFRRVAALAMKSWKSGYQYGDKFGNTQADSYVPWPLSGSDTRHHLRQMVKRNVDTPSVEGYQGRDTLSPLAGAQARSTQRNPSSSEFDEQAFWGRDIAIALTTSTSESMQPDGPLAQLAREPGSDVFGGFVHMRTGQNLVKDPAQERLRGLLQESRQHRRQRFNSPPYIADTYSPTRETKTDELPKGPNTYGGASPLSPMSPIWSSAFRAKDSYDNAQRLRSPPRLSDANGKHPRPMCLTKTFMEMSEMHKQKEKRKQKKARSRSKERQQSPQLPKSPRIRRPAVSTEVFSCGPPLPPGWGSSNTPDVVQSDPIEMPTDLDSPFPATTTTTTTSTVPRERVNKRVNKNPRTSGQRPMAFDRSYFRRFNEEQAKLQSGGGHADADMLDGSSSETSSSSDEE